MTINNIIDLFQAISVAHYQIEGFGFGNIFEINGNINPGLKYPLLWVTPQESTTREWTKERKFTLFVLNVGHHDQSDRNEIWSDTESILTDIVKILNNESDDYELIGDATMQPISEKFADWTTGWQCDLTIETELNSNYCDIPAAGLNKPVSIPGYAIIKDQYGNIITELKPGEIYTIEILDTIQQSLDDVTPTIIQVLS